MEIYDKYKPSGVDWIGDIPEHWNVKKLKYLVDLIDKTISDTSFLIGVENIESKTGKLIDLDGDKTYQGVINEFQKGDVLFNKLRPYLAKVYFAEQSGGYFGELLNFRAGKELHNKFLYYRVFSADFINVVNSSTTGTKMPRASWEDFISHLLIALPPIPEQIAIADYLDKKMAQIDSLIDNILRLIDLLKEERAAIISHAVTRGINPYAKLKPSGIVRLGDIPEHWEVKKLKYVLRVNSGDGIKSEDIKLEGAYPVYGGNGILGYTENYNYETTEIIIGRVGAKCGNVRLVDGKKWISDNALVATVCNGYRLDYVAMLLESLNLNSLANQNAQPLITGTLVKEKISAFPPTADEQDQITEFIEATTSKIDLTIGKMEKEIGFMREYRTALISEVITGRIKVV